MALRSGRSEMHLKEANVNLSQVVRKMSDVTVPFSDCSPNSGVDRTAFLNDRAAS